MQTPARFKLKAIILAVCLLGMTLSSTCPSGTTIAEVNRLREYSWDLGATTNELRGVIVGASGTTYYHYYEVTGPESHIVKENPDETIAWANKYWTNMVEINSWIVDNAETYMYTLESTSLLNAIEILKIDVNDPTIRTFGHM